MKHTLVIGTDFRKSSLKMREKLFLNDEVKPSFIRKVINSAVIQECVILTTCNRVEIYIICSNPDQAKIDIINTLSMFHGIPTNLFKENLYIYQCEKAIRHLFRVVSGLESMIVGESEILGQIKKAYDLSNEFNGTGPYLNKLFQAAITLGKKVRSKTPVNTGITSIGSAAAKIAIESKQGKDAKFGIIGCGEMGRTVSSHLVQSGIQNIYLLNRTESKGQDLANKVDGYFLPFNKIYHVLKISDVIISATSANNYIITKKQLHNILKEKKHLTIIDIATPRDVEPLTKTYNNLTLYTIDDIQNIVDSNIQLRHSAIAMIDQYIDTKLSYFNDWYNLRNSYEQTNNSGNKSFKPSSGSDTNSKK